MAFRIFHSGTPLQLELFRRERFWLAAWRRASAGDAPDRELFDGGPPTGLQTAIGLMRPGRPNIGLTRFRDITGAGRLDTGAFACATCIPAANTVNLTDNWQVGWTVGAGVEWRFAPQWSVKAEYLYVDLGNISSTINYNYGPSSSLTSTYNERDNIVRAGINYKFW